MGLRRRPKLDEGFAALGHASLNEKSDNDLLSQPGATAPHFEGKPDASQHALFGRVITKPSSKSVAQTIDGLRHLMAEPPLTAHAVGHAADVLPEAARRPYRQVRRRMRPARRAPAGQPTEVALHQARKAAKRARYAGEAMTRRSA